MPTPSAAFILSLDTEIAWGTYGDVGERAAAFDNYTALLQRLVNLLNIYEIPATWALVGGLLDRAADESVPVPQYAFADKPDTDRTRFLPEPWTYAPGVLDTIRNMRVPQEIATHTLTHLLADDPAVDREAFCAQLAAVTRLHKLHGLPPPRSLVYPQNRVAYVDALPTYGIIAYRGVAADWYAALPKSLRRPAHLVDRALAFPPPTYPVPRGDSPPVNLPASQFLMSYDGVRRRIPTSARVRQAARGIARAADRGEVFHLWFHPFNLGSSDAMFEALTAILALVYEARDAGNIRTVTMGGLAAAALRDTPPL